jgi:hypothetical protein
MMPTAESVGSHYSPLATYAFALAPDIRYSSFFVFSWTVETSPHRLNAYSTPFYVSLNLLDGQ